MEWIRVTNRLILLVAELNSLDDEEEDGEEEDEQWGDTQHKEASTADYTPTFSTFLNLNTLPKNKRKNHTHCVYN